MRALAILGLLVALASAALCVRLGFWQLARLAEKRALNAALRTAEGAPALAVTGDPPPASQAVDRPLQATGRFDETRQFLLAGRLHEGEPGVEVVTPLRLATSDTAILVNRGWLPAADAATARPQEHPEPGPRTVRGVAEAVGRGAGGPAPRPLAGDGIRLWSLRELDADSLGLRLAYPVAPYVLRESPGPGVPASPRRSSRRLHDESVHLGYAFQWFLFAVLILAGTAALASTRARRAGPRPIPEART